MPISLIPGLEQLSRVTTMTDFPDHPINDVFSNKSTAAGLGLRREIINDLESYQNEQGDEPLFDFMEVAPENWIGVGGKYAKKLRAFTERYPLTLHGLSLNIGGFAPLDFELLEGIKDFIKTHNCKIYSEHLSYCADDAHLYDLLPIPFTEQAVESVVERIGRVQDFLGQRIALENVSYYTPLTTELSEIDFINEVIRRADCDLLLDVNNVYVNSINHRYDAEAFIQSMPAEKVRYMHIAGHYVEAEDLRVDTHGSNIINPVFELLAFACQHIGVVPTLLERDFNFPAMSELIAEVDQIRAIQLAEVSRQDQAQTQTVLPGHS